MASARKKELTGLPPQARRRAQEELGFSEDLGGTIVHWRVERVAWVVFGLLILGALLGLTGRGGPLARSVARAPGLEVDYPRIARWSTPDDIELVIRDGGPQPTVRLGPGFARVFRIEEVRPTPVRWSAGAQGQSLAFAPQDAGRPLHVRIQVRPRRPAFARPATIAIADRRPADLRLNVLP